MRAPPEERGWTFETYNRVDELAGTGVIAAPSWFNMSISSSACSTCSICSAGAAGAWCARTGSDCRNKNAAARARPAHAAAGTNRRHHHPRFSISWIRRNSRRSKSGESDSSGASASSRAAHTAFCASARSRHSAQQLHVTLKLGRGVRVQSPGAVSDDELPAVIEFQWASHTTLPPPASYLARPLGQVRQPLPQRLVGAKQQRFHG